MRGRTCLWGRIFGVLAMFAVSACAGEPTPDPPVLEGKLSSIQELVFTPSCATSSCHSSTSKAGNLQLTPETSYAELVDKFAENGTAKAEGLKRVAPGNADESFLVTKIQKITKSEYGLAMPTGSPDGVPADQLKAIKDWINAGAKND